MNLTNDFLMQAQGCIERAMRARRSDIQSGYGSAHVDMKSNHTPVTDLDKALEKDLRSVLKNFDSSIGIEGEEYGIEGSRETFWLVDPIDGTENFIRGLPFVRNMVTLIDNNKPVFCVVYKPITDELFVAAEGDGAYKNGKQIHVSDRPLSRAWVEMGWNNYNDTKSLAVAGALHKKINGFRTTGEFLYTAEGKIDAHIAFSGGGGAWDYAPSALLIKEAGGRVANIGSDSYDIADTSFIMANPVIFDDLMSIASEALLDYEKDHSEA